MTPSLALDLYAYYTVEDSKWCQGSSTWEMETLDSWIQGCNCETAILLDGVPVGTISYDNESNFGFWVAGPYRRKGIAVQAGKMFLSSIECDVYAGSWSDNTASVKVLISLGFRERSREPSRKATIVWWIRECNH
jgi:RimJ/RimL family protein N-acetyltransferase